MKKSIIFVLLICIFGFVFQFQSYSKPPQPDAKGGFKTCTVTIYQYHDGKVNMKSGQKSYTSNFDDKGYQIEMISYDNNKISQKNKITNKYNTKGLPIEVNVLDESGKSITKVTIGYDDKMNKINDTIYNDAGEATQRGTYKYDANNFMVEEIHETRVENNKFIKGSTYYKNDKYGNKIEESAVHGISANIQVTTDYNLDNNKSETKTSEVSSESNAMPPDKITYDYKYDAKGNIIRHVRNGIGTKLIYEYKYDKYGNIIEQIDFDENNKPVIKTAYVYQF